MHGLTHCVVAAKRKGDIAHTTADERVRTGGFNLAARRNKRLRVVVVFFKPRCNGEDVRIEDDVCRWKSTLLCQKPICPLAYLHFPFASFGLPLFVKRHDDDSGTVSANLARFLQEICLAILQTNRVDNPFSLNTREACLKHLPPTGIQHDRHAANIRFCSDEVEELHHRLFRI